MVALTARLLHSPRQCPVPTERSMGTVHVTMSKAPSLDASTSRRRGVEKVGYGALPNQLEGLGSVVSYPIEVRGGAPAGRNEM